MDSNLLVTKIIVPSKRTDVLRRQRLLKFMHDYLGRKLLLISATAGYGKTSLLVDFVHDTELPVCWYSLDEGDRDPQVFLEYLVASIQRRFPQFGGRTTALLRASGEKRSLDAYIGALVTEIHEQINSLFVFVLDDYHIVENSQPVNQLVDRLLTVLPENVRLILSSRTIPAQLTLTKLTAQQQVAGLGAVDLRFTAGEISALVQQNYGLEISSTIAEDLAAQSEGWITGIVLTTPSLWRGLLHEWIKGYGPGSQLFEYLAGEVLLQQTPELQQFLLDTSVLGEMNGAICNELLGRTDADAMLQLAEKRNLFITRLEDQGYRYHHLFREFLQTRLHQTQPVRHDDLLRRAAALFERQGKVDQAIDLWLGAHQTSEAARLLLQVAENYFQLGRWTTLTRWLDELGENALLEEPQLLLWRAILGAEAGNIELAQNAFTEALVEFEKRSDYPNLARALIQSARYEENSAQGIEKCEQALGILAPHEYLLQAQGNRIMGSLAHHSGNNLEAVRLLERAGALAERANNPYLKSEIEHSLGSVTQLLGNRSEAETHFQKARLYWERLGFSAKLANTLNSIALLRYQRGELSRARELLLEALKQSHQSGYLRVEGYVLATLGDVYRDQGKMSDALDAYMSASELANKVHDAFLTIFAQVAAADIWRMTQEFASAEELLNAALSSATLHDSDYEVGLVQVGLGALALARQDSEVAVRQLEHAMPLIQQAHALRDVGRAYFFLAHAAIQRKQTAAAVQNLRALAAIGIELDEDQFLWSEMVHARNVLAFALKRKAGLGYFRRLAKKLEQQPLSHSASVVSYETTYPRLELFTFGDAHVRMDGVLVPKSTWQTATTQELFFFFATNPQGWRKEQVIEALWMNAPSGQASDLFHASVYRIRRALFPECFLYQNGVYRINPEVAFWLDADEFDKALEAAARAQEPMDIIASLERAIELYRGDLMTDVYSDWCIPRREQLRTRYLNALSQLAQLHFESENPSRAIELYRQVLAWDSTHEATYRGLIQIYTQQGNRSAAIQTFQQCVESLKSELNVPPMPETLELYQRLLKNS